METTIEKQIRIMLSKNKQNYPVVCPDRRTTLYRLAKAAGVKFVANSNEYARMIRACRAEAYFRHPKVSGYDYVNVLNNPLYVDYKNNYNSIKFISNDRINFYGRNHWAKNNLDKKILTIIKKHYGNNIE